MAIRELGIFLTRHCNFQCLYCCVHTGLDLPEKLTRQELRGLVAQAKKMGARTVLIAGEGEPLLDEEFFPLLEYVCAQKMTCRLATNMSLIDESAAKRLFKFRVQVIGKLNSLVPATQDFLAGRQQAHLWMSQELDGESVVLPAGLVYLLRAGYAKFPIRHKMLILQSVITRYNQDDIRALALFCRRHTIGIDIERLLPSRDLARFQELRVSRIEEEALYRVIAGIMGWRYRICSRIRCAFETNPFVDSCGNIQFCFGEERSVGNIRDTPLAELHRLQMRLKNSLGAPSAFLRYRSGFRMCRTRRLLENAGYRRS